MSTPFTNYKDNRRSQYPEIGDQLDDLYKKGAFSADMAAKIKKVKDDNPKPQEDGPISTLNAQNVKHETSGINTLVFDNGGTSGGNGRVTCKGTIGEISALGNKPGDVTIDMRTANNFSMTLTGTIALKNPSNIAAGQSGVIYISQDGTGGRTWSAESYWDFPSGTLPTLSTGANAVDAVVWHARTASKITAQVVLDLQ